MVPAPRYDNFDDLKTHLEAKCLARQGDTLRGHTQTIGERLVSDLDALMGLPVAEYEELLSNLVFESFWSCGDLAFWGCFNSVFERDACDDFGEVVKAA